MFCALLGQISGERLQDHWSSGYEDLTKIIFQLSLKYHQIGTLSLLTSSFLKRNYYFQSIEESSVRTARCSFSTETTCSRVRILSNSIMLTCPFDL